jgi:hypothetical protein
MLKKFYINLKPHAILLHREFQFENLSEKSLKTNAWKIRNILKINI